MKSFITGFTGTGKSTVCQELISRKIEGYSVYDTDFFPGLCYWKNLKTLENIRSEYPEDYHIDRYGWFWDKNVLSAALVNHDNIIFCGSSNNMRDFFNLFDRVFVLSVSADEQIRRIQERQDYGSADPLLQQRATEQQALLVAYAREIGATIIDASGPITDIVDGIINSLQMN